MPASRAFSLLTPSSPAILPMTQTTQTQHNIMRCDHICELVHTRINPLWPSQKGIALLCSEEGDSPAVVEVVRSVQAFHAAPHELHDTVRQCLHPRALLIWWSNRKIVLGGK